MNNSHQQSPKENIESKCKNTRKLTLKQEDMKMCRNFQQNITWGRWTVEGGEESGKGEENSEANPFSSPPIGLNK